MDQNTSPKPVFFRLFVKVLVVAMFLSCLVALQVSQGGPNALAASRASSSTTSVTQAEHAAIPANTINCGIVTCSIYFSRHTTRWIASNGVLAVIGLGFIPVVGRLIAAAAGIVVWKATQARSKNQCLRIRYIRFGVPSIVGFYSDGSRYCKN